MDVVSIIVGLLGSLNSIPAVGKYVAMAVSAAMALVVIVNTLVAGWHALVVVLNALSAVPGLSGLKSAADALLADQASIDDFAKNKLLPILSQLSSLPLPAAKKA